MYWALMYLETDWQNLIGNVGPGINNDGIVAWASSDYPGGTRIRHLDPAVWEIHHLEQLDWVPNHDADPFRVLISQSVVEDLGIVPEPPPPPPPPFTISIGGPTQIKPTAFCGWAVNINGGVPPYTYSWSRDGQPSGTSDLYYGGMSGAQSFNLLVWVWDAQMNGRTDAITVYSDPQAFECLQ